MKQLRENWRKGDIDMTLAKSTTRVPLLKLVDFDKTIDAAKLELAKAAGATTGAAGAGAVASCAVGCALAQNGPRARGWARKPDNRRSRGGR